MGFDAAHAISCLAKLALRISRNTRSREEDGFFGWMRFWPAAFRRA